MNNKEYVVIGAAIFLTVIAWIVFGVYHARSTSSISEKEMKQVVPINPKFDTDLIIKLQKREE